jgi:hypothetical protein
MVAMLKGNTVNPLAAPLSIDDSLTDHSLLQIHHSTHSHICKRFDHQTYAHFTGTSEPSRKINYVG